MDVEGGSSLNLCEARKAGLAINHFENSPIRTAPALTAWAKYSKESAQQNVFGGTLINMWGDVPWRPEGG